MRTARSKILLLLALSAAPAIATLFVLLLIRVDAYQTHHHLSIGESIRQTLADLMRLIRAGGAFGAMLLIINHVMSFGIVVVLSVLASRWWHWKRVACFYIVSVALLIGVAFSLPGHLYPLGGTRSTWFMSAVGPDFWVGDFHDYWISYPLSALALAILLGGLVALLPVSGPSKRERIERGICPKCRYELQGKIDKGCPECGWNRQGPTAGREGLFLSQRPHRTVVLLVAAWTMMVMVVAVILRPQMVLLMPSAIDSAPHVALRNPKSAAYWEVAIDFTIRSRTGWFHLPDKVTRMQWTAEFRDATRLPSFEEQLAGVQAEHEALATIVVDQTGGSAILRHGEREVRHDGAIDRAQLTWWMESIFPNAARHSLDKEAEAILAAVETWMDPLWTNENPHEVLWRPMGSPFNEAFRGASSGSRGWDARTAPFAIVLVIGGLVLFWLYGAILIVRWGHRRARSNGPRSVNNAVRES